VTGTSRQPAADLGRFVAELARFVEFAEEEAALVRRSAPLVLRHESALTAAVYQHFLRYPTASRFFLSSDGTPDVERVERRQHSLGRWLRETAQASLAPGFSYGLLGVGLAHSHRAHGPGGAVPPELVVGAASLLQTALARVLRDEMSDAGEALAASIAWNKLLLLHVNVLLLGYFIPWREQQAAGAGSSGIDRQGETTPVRAERGEDRSGGQHR
jgi:Protoglobin